MASWLYEGNSPTQSISALLWTYFLIMPQTVLAFTLGINWALSLPFLCLTPMIIALLLAPRPRLPWALPPRYVSSASTMPLNFCMKSESFMARLMRCIIYQAVLYVTFKSRCICLAEIPFLALHKRNVARIHLLSGKWLPWKIVPAVTENIYRHLRHWNLWTVLIREMARDLQRGHSGPSGNRSRSRNSKHASLVLNRSASSIKDVISWLPSKKFFNFFLDRSQDLWYRLSRVEFLALCQGSASGSSENFSEWKNSPQKECCGPAGIRTQSLQLSKSGALSSYTTGPIQCGAGGLNPSYLIQSQVSYANRLAPQDGRSRNAATLRLLFFFLPFSKAKSGLVVL